MDVKKAVEVQVSGRVQRVGYRNFIFEKAIELSIVGFVQNKTDGTVFVYAIGTNLQIDEFLQWCQKGSPMAKVEKMEVKSVSVNNLIHFYIKRD